MEAWHVLYQLLKKQKIVKQHQKKYSQNNERNACYFFGFHFFVFNCYAWRGLFLLFVSCPVLLYYMPVCSFLFWRRPIRNSVFAVRNHMEQLALCGYVA